MINYNNHNITGISYNNHSIKYVYGCGGNLVWSGDTPTPPTPTGTKFYATYNDDTTFSVDCDGDSVLRTGTTRYGGYSKYSSMTSAVIGNCITSLDEYSFKDCVSLSSVTIPNSVTEFKGAAFEYCYSLTSVGVVGSGASVEIPSGLTSFPYGSEFSYCTGLTDVVIGDQITELSYNIFGNCTSLRNLTIGSGVTSIGSNAFQGCTSLTSIVINAPTPPTSDTTPNNWKAFDYTNNAPIFVLDTSVNDYKTSSLWSQYADRIKPLSEKP